jgi:formylglycine-generating enzyme required for sulfatase activity
MVFQDIDEGALLYRKNVTLTKGFYIGKYLVTNNDWTKLMGTEHTGSVAHQSGSNPVNNVSWNDCDAYIKTLSKLTGKQFRLPTEAEWIFAAKGGSKSQGYIYAGSNNLDDVGWYGMILQSRKKIDLFKLRSKDEIYLEATGNCKTPFQPVGLLEPNELDIFDMSGHVWEWTNDYWTDTYEEGSDWVNPAGANTGEYKVLHGGSFMDSKANCRISSRNYLQLDDRNTWSGFRLVIEHF